VIKIPDESVEAVARLMCKQDGLDPDRMQFSQGIPKWVLYVDHARAAIAAALNAWPDMEVRPTFNPSRIILPLPQENPND